MVPSTTVGYMSELLQPVAEIFINLTTGRAVHTLLYHR